MLKTQKGFTLIELIMIIVIIGILAAVAVPRFISLQGDARAAAINGLYGSVRSAAAMVKATALVRGVTNTTVTTEDGTIVNIENRYPETAAGGINLAVELDVLAFAYDGATGIFTHIGAAAANSATCRVTYAQPLALGDPPLITAVATNCN